MVSCIYLYTMELYPTEIRQMGISVGNFAIRFGSLLSPLVLIVTHRSPVLLLLLCATVQFLSALAISFLIETHGLPLLDTIHETETRIKRLQSPKGNASQDVQERPGLFTPEIPEAESPV
ncbi:solute carrier family 22 member 6-like [Antechinus flavipes]|uniref:solute carrier family 22 member 6-like n=1 Tax=Antechinus flavipes TaxID=38775 RepID=UPI0022366B72|nr:solute carrier family 22 member 6-like [Antechinus flavipes]